MLGRPRMFLDRKPGPPPDGPLHESLRSVLDEAQRLASGFDCQHTLPPKESSELLVQLARIHQELDALEEGVDKMVAACSPQAQREEQSLAARDQGLGALRKLPTEVMALVLQDLDYRGLFNLALVSRAVNQQAVTVLLQEVETSRNRQIAPLQSLLHHLSLLPASLPIKTLLIRDDSTQGVASDTRLPYHRRLISVVAPVIRYLQLKVWPTEPQNFARLKGYTIRAAFTLKLMSSETEGDARVVHAGETAVVNDIMKHFNSSEFPSLESLCLVFNISKWTPMIPYTEQEARDHGYSPLSLPLDFVKRMPRIRRFMLEYTCIADEDSALPVPLQFDAAQSVPLKHLEAIGFNWSSRRDSRGPHVLHLPARDLQNMFGVCENLTSLYLNIGMSIDAAELEELRPLPSLQTIAISWSRLDVLRRLLPSPRPISRLILLGEVPHNQLAGAMQGLACEPAYLTLDLASGPPVPGWSARHYLGPILAAAPRLVGLRLQDLPCLPTLDVLDGLEQLLPATLETLHFQYCESFAVTTLHRAGMRAAMFQISRLFDSKPKLSAMVCPRLEHGYTYARPSPGAAIGIVMHTHLPEGRVGGYDPVRWNNLFGTWQSFQRLNADRKKAPFWERGEDEY